MQPGEKQLGEMQLEEIQHLNTTPLGEMQSGEMQFGEMQLSLYRCLYFISHQSNISRIGYTKIYKGHTEKRNPMPTQMLVIVIIP